MPRGDKPIQRKEIRAQCKNIATYGGHKWNFEHTVSCVQSVTQIEYVIYFMH